MDESCYINESVLLNYFAGELPADRRKEVEEWIAASEDNEKMARDIFRLYRAADTLDYMNRVDASAALQQVKGRIHKHRHRISWMVLGAAYCCLYGVTAACHHPLFNSEKSAARICGDTDQSRYGG